MRFFDIFEFRSQVFLEIEYDDSLEQGLASSREKPSILEPKYGPNRPNLSRNQFFFCHFLKFVLSFLFFYIAQDDSSKQCITTSRSKTHTKQNKTKHLKLKIEHKIRFLCMMLHRIAVGIMSNIQKTQNLQKKILMQIRASPAQVKTEIRFSIIFFLLY